MNEATCGGVEANALELLHAVSCVGGSLGHATPQCREGESCGPNWIFVFALVLFLGWVPWLAGSIALVVFGLRARVAQNRIAVAVVVGSTLAFFGGVGLVFTGDSVLRSGSGDTAFFAWNTGGIALVEAVYVGFWAMRWQREVAKRRMQGSRDRELRPALGAAKKPPVQEDHAEDPGETERRE